jgi:hypothetical protein
LYEKTVEVFFKGERIAIHPRSFKHFEHTLLQEHMPERHRKHLAWTPHRLISWAEKIGPNTVAVVKAILESKPFVEMGYRPALGVIRLAESYGAEKMERVCEYAYSHRLLRVHQLTQLLKMESGIIPISMAVEPKIVAHGNVRGMAKYTKGEV